MIRKASDNGPFGKYGNMENQAKANISGSLSNHTPLDVAVELAFSKGNYGYPFLRENFEAEIVNDGIRYEGKFSRWLADTGFYDNVPRKEETLSPEEIGIMVPVDGKRSKHWQVDLTAYDSVFNCNINNAGKMLSKEENFRQMWINYLQSEDGQAIMAEQEAEGYEKPTIKGLTVGLTPESALITLRNWRKGVVVSRNLEFYKQIAEEAAHYGMTISEYLAANPRLAGELAKRATLAEEVKHMYKGIPARNIVSLLKEELATKESARAYFEKRAKGAGKDEKRARDYSFLEKIMEQDIATTPERYLSLYLSASKAGYSRSKVNALIAKYLAEAIGEGYEGKGAVNEAVSRAEAEVEHKSGNKGKKAAKVKGKKSDKDLEEDSDEKETNDGTEDDEGSVDSGSDDGGEGGTS